MFIPGGYRTMITVTEAAQKEIVHLIENQKEPVKGVRVKADPISPLRANYRLAFVAEGQEEENDHVEPFDGFNIYVDPDSVNYVQDITIDFVDSLMGRGFKIENPHIGRDEWILCLLQINHHRK